MVWRRRNKQWFSTPQLGCSGCEDITDKELPATLSIMSYDVLRECICRCKLVYYIRVLSLAFLILTNCKRFSFRFLRRLYISLCNPSSYQAIILCLHNPSNLHLTFLYILSYITLIKYIICIIPAILHFGRLLTNRPKWIHFGN